jgi:hypothetical protein
MWKVTVSFTGLFSLRVTAAAGPLGSSVSRETVSKMGRFSLPPGYTCTKPTGKPKLGILLPVIDEILQSDQAGPVKQRRSSKRKFERLRDEHDFGGGLYGGEGLLFFATQLLRLVSPGCHRFHQRA